MSNNNVTVQDNIINFDDALNKSDKLIENLKTIKNIGFDVRFLKVKDVMELTGFSKNRVLDLFSDPEFPSCNYGKAQIVEIHAFIEYFSVPRKKEKSKYWRNIA